MTPTSSVLALAATATLLLNAVSVERGVATDSLVVEPVDFVNDLIPVLTRSGCNAGGCHGAAIGRGGFRLSLLGGNPRKDFESIVTELGGRRVNLAQPEESLVYLKPTASLKHGGKLALAEDSEGAELLLRWIDEGAQFTQHRTLAKVEVTPGLNTADALGETVPLTTTAHYTDGTSRNVTQCTVFQAEDPSAVMVDADRNTALVLRRGRHVVIARYLGKVVPMEFLVPLTDEQVDLAKEPRHNFIDEEVLATLASLRIPVSEMADDATYLRRLTLDLTGRLPQASRVRAFLKDPDVGKRAKMVDELLKSEGFVEHFTLQLSKLLRLRSQGGKNSITIRPSAVRRYHEWIADQVRKGTGYDQLARSLIEAGGDSREVGQANFYRTAEDPLLHTEFVTELFMGSRMRCANCHNHPLDKWTQDDYHGLVAIFAKIGRAEVVEVNAIGTAMHPVTGQPAKLRIPGVCDLPADVLDGRRAFADWLTREDNPYFARAIVNRLWQSMMGRGLVTPVDDFRDTNPATHPSLLTRLATDFVSHGFDLRHTLRRIATSATYARSANAVAQNAADDRYYSHALRRKLAPEVLADAMSDVLGVAGFYGTESEGTRAVSLPDASIKSDALDVLGRCGRTVSCESASAPVGELPRKLHLFNGELLNGRLGVKGSRLAQLLEAGASPRTIVTEYYLAALGRLPTSNETEFWQQQGTSGGAAELQRELLEDFVWSLLTCNEFQTNH
ncbi:MAG: hypothetical protein ACI9SE_004207 [Neolewinella sp.]|jgi:hypothetical protein